MKLKGRNEIEEIILIKGQINEGNKLYEEN